MKRVLTVCSMLAVLLLLPEAAHACESCFGAGADSETTRGIGLAMLSLLVLTGVIWGGVGAFFLNVRKRVRMLSPGDLVVNEYGELCDASTRGDDHAMNA